MASSLVDSRRIVPTHPVHRALGRCLFSSFLNRTQGLTLVLTVLDGNHQTTGATGSASITVIECMVYKISVNYASSFGTHILTYEPKSDERDTVNQAPKIFLKATRIAVVMPYACPTAFCVAVRTHLPRRIWLTFWPAVKRTSNLQFLITDQQIRLLHSSGRCSNRTSLFSTLFGVCMKSHTGSNVLTH